MAIVLPSPYAYLDHRAFVGDWFAAKKEANPRYSHRLFATKAGVSVSLLTHVVQGRRNLTASTTEAFVKAMGLRSGEARFFRLLVSFDAAEDAGERNQIWQQISTTRRFREARGIEGMAFEYLSSWAYPAIRELARHPAFQADPAWVASHLRPTITPAEASKAIEVLQRLGMLVEKEGRLVPAEASVATPPELTSLAVRNYHHGMIGKGQESIERFPGSERHLLAVTVGVPRRLVPRLKEEATAMMQRLMNLCDAEEADMEQVVQINLQLFPLTEALPAGEEEA
jgi:uncharacterized protein (TIGR02147 family)